MQPGLDFRGLLHHSATAKKWIWPIIQFQKPAHGAVQMAMS